MDTRDFFALPRYFSKSSFVRKWLIFCRFVGLDFFQCVRRLRGLYWYAWQVVGSSGYLGNYCLSR